MNKIIILRGNCASGKTTVSKELQKRLGRGTFLIPLDVVRREMLWLKGNTKPTVDLLMRMVEFGNQNCTFTILEGLLYSDSYESLFKHIAKIYGKNIFAYYLDAPFEVTLKRHQQRPIHNSFGEKEMREWWRDDDYIKNIKETTIDSVAMSSAEIVEKILFDLGEAK